MSRKRTRYESLSDRSNDNIEYSKKKCTDAAKSMNINVEDIEIGESTQSNNKKTKGTVSASPRYLFI